MMTIIVMLILVAVTVKIGNDQGLFSNAREAKSGTAYSAEEENLAMYMYGEGVYNATTGEIDLIKLKDNLEKSGEWGEATIAGTKLTVLGKQSGQQHIINADGTMGEKKDDDSSDILGKKFYVTGEETKYGDYFQFNSDATLTFVGHDKDNPAEEQIDNSMKYEYNPTTKKGQLKAHYEEDGESWDETMDFDYRIVKDESGNEINQVIIFSGSMQCHIYATNKNEGLTPLGNNVYANGNKTIEFGKTSQDGQIFGTYTIKENGSIINSGGEGYYTCYNQIIDGIHGVGEVAISADHSTITLIEEGIVYTKQ